MASDSMACTLPWLCPDSLCIVVCGAFFYCVETVREGEVVTAVILEILILVVD